MPVGLCGLGFATEGGTDLTHSGHESSSDHLWGNALIISSKDAGFYGRTSIGMDMPSINTTGWPKDHPNASATKY